MATLTEEKAQMRKVAFKSRKAAFDRGGDATDNLLSVMSGIKGAVIAGY